MSTWIEIIATIFGLLCVVLTIRQHIACWPTGLVQVLLFIWIFAEARLYSDALLHVVYVFLCLYGWYRWTHVGEPAQSDKRSTLPVTTLTPAARAGWLLTALAGAGLLGWIMHRFTDASLPYWDAGIASLSLVSQYLMARKWIESWIGWITVDIIAIGVYFNKSLYFTTGLYCVFLVLAVIGLFSWRRDLMTRHATPTSPAASG